MKIQTFSGRLAAISVAALLVLCACGGGGDGGAQVGTGASGGAGDSGSTTGGSTEASTEASTDGSTDDGTDGTVVNKATVGGTVSGLTVDGMALLNNGSDKLNVANAATTFKFATSLLSGSTYDVSFASYPYGLACALSGQTGTVTTDITSVAIACADWTSANATVSVFAGSTFGTADGTGTAAQFGSLFGLGFDASGTLYIADRDNHMIRKITAAGVVTTLAGSTTSGSLDGTGTSARFNLPAGIAVDPGGDVYIADRGNNMIRKITQTGVVTTVAGSTAAGSLDGTGTAARFDTPWGIVVDGSGNLFVADQSNNEIRKITPAGVVTTFAGAGPSSPGFADGTGTAATFSQPSGLAIDANGNLYVADQLNHAIRKITPSGLVTTIAGNGTGGNLDGTGAAARFQNPIGVAVDGAGNVYVADTQNNKIRKISASGIVITLAGAASSGLTNGLGSAARFNMPLGVALDSMGNAYVADSGNTVVRKIARVP